MGLEEWATLLRNDPELGGANLQRTTSTVRAAVEKYAGNPEQTRHFRNFVQESGLGDHPDFVRLIYNMATIIERRGTKNGS